MRESPISLSQVNKNPRALIGQQAMAKIFPGIHGYPAVPWDNAPPPAIPNPGNPKENLYCTHRRNTFPTWHRPYMLLFEVSVCDMSKIEETLTTSSNVSTSLCTVLSPRFQEGVIMTSGLSKLANGVCLIGTGLGIKRT